jgi:cyclopropane fatty-acyl-phospholipid synthase-like methyltransferase
MSKNKNTKEKQYNVMLDYQEQRGLETLGLMTSQAWYDDPKRLTFTLARYKFAAKMLSGSKHVLEVGCADAFATRIVVQEVEKLTATDFDPLFVADTLSRMSERWAFNCVSHDMLDGPVVGDFDGIYALDVLEHINPSDEERFLSNMVDSLEENGVILIGMPTIESQDYASKLSKEGHVNCKSMPDLKVSMQKYFHNVFMFSMNDEVVHTGYHKMAHYIFALCCNKK